MGSIQNELNDFLQKLTGNHVSANECDSGTNYLRQPRYHCNSRSFPLQFVIISSPLPEMVQGGEEGFLISLLHLLVMMLVVTLWTLPTTTSWQPLFLDRNTSQLEITVAQVDVVYANRVGVLVRSPFLRGQLCFLGTASS